MNIGIMGGTFDPVHNGHIALAQSAYETFGLDEIWFMPNGRPPHKDPESIESNAIDRTEMVKIAISDVPYFKLNDYEVQKDQVSYSYETLEAFGKMYPEDHFYFIIGADSLFAIEKWVYPERIFATCTILAACRDNIDTKSQMEEQISYLRTKYMADIRWLPAPLILVSSHGLRAMVKDGEDISAYVPENVIKYINEAGLYGSKD